MGGGEAHLGDPGYDDRALLPRGLELQLRGALSASGPTGMQDIVWEQTNTEALPTFLRPFLLISFEMFFFVKHL